MVWTTAFLFPAPGHLKALSAQTLLLWWNWLLRTYEERRRTLWTLVFDIYVIGSSVVTMRSGLPDRI
ncbi:hypothetical protein SJ05684_b49560 (plasmid) [Sinorhizobium sojae CCBAU 05684]|uniref:Uncharacterized protein n=1 Tax=Sinorhizobium sojae CCBAU 05684 TaxID=716928 RepID=A0A249PJ52_9HYPH|nr:hypothetical protein SJ05684_b49560 [Sinorhizobium sojae CCBAU 05684]